MRLKSLLFVTASLLLTTGCSSRTSSSLSDKGSSKENTSSKESIVGAASSLKGNDDTSASSKKALVVYYSATNHTKAVADTISSHLDAPTFQLTPVTPYTSADLNYSSSNSRVSKEHNDPNRHTELVSTTSPDFATADYIFLGAPVWWGELSWVINDFVSENDFSGKTVIPFGTSASSSFSCTNLKALDGKGTWLSEKRFSSSVASKDVVSWVNSLSL